MGKRKEKQKKDEILTFNFEGKSYIFDGILSFVPTLIQDGWIVVCCYGKNFRLPLHCTTIVQRSDGKAAYVISDRKNQIVADYIYENMSYLATRDGMAGKKWDDLVEE